MKWNIAHPCMVGLEPTTPRLHAECYNRWATGTWHFPIYGWDTDSGEQYPSLLYVNYTIMDSDSNVVTYYYMLWQFNYPIPNGYAVDF